MKSIFSKSLLLALFAVISTNCATIIHGSKQSISISSNPSQATVTVDNAEKGMTPVTIALSRKDNHSIKINLNGYMPYETNLTRKVDGWIAGNIVIGGLIGLAIDAISGGMYKLTPEQVQAELRNEGASILKPDDGIFLTVVLRPDPRWERIGQLEKIAN